MHNTEMTDPIRILVQTTIPFAENDWHIGRFALLSQHLASIRGADGTCLYEVTARDRVTGDSGDDTVLIAIDESDFDEVWLMAADSGNGLTDTECEALNRFRQRGGGLLTTRDHQDLGSSICRIDGVGRANFFHSTNQEPDETRRVRDDQDTEMIDFPNYHSGRNGDFQKITVASPAIRYSFVRTELRSNISRHIHTKVRSESLLTINRRALWRAEPVR